MNPVANTNKPVKKEIPRERVLSDAELVAVWKACGDDDYGRIIRLLILTAQRRDEIGSLAWNELDLDGALWSIPGGRTKNGRDHDVPLSPAAIEVLCDVKKGDRPLVFGTGEGGFSGWSKAKAALDKRIADVWPTDTKPFEQWTVHDLRRTVATIMAESPRQEGASHEPKRIGLGIAPHIVESLLNHLSGHRAGIAAVYNRASYATEKRQALDRWAEHLTGLVKGRNSKIVSLKRPA